ncbi:hypothetical protein bcgnr5380_63780 [Bacillus cereus]
MLLLRVGLRARGSIEPVKVGLGKCCGVRGRRMRRAAGAAETRDASRGDKGVADTSKRMKSM